MKKYKDMAFNEKIEHIIYYYKWHIIIGIIIILVLGYTVQSFLERDKNIPLMTFSLQGPATMDNEKKFNWEQIMTERIVQDEIDEIDKKVRVDFYAINLEYPNEYSEANIQKLITHSAVGELDIVCLDEAFYIQQAKAGAFFPLDTIPEIASIIDSHKDNMVELTVEDESEKHIYGMKADEINFFEELGYDTKGKIIGISVSTHRMDYCIETLKLIFEK